MTEETELRIDAFEKRARSETGVPLVKFENIEEPKNAGKDYFGGPIKIPGNECQTAAPGQPKNDQQPGLVRVQLSLVESKDGKELRREVSAAKEAAQ